MTSRWIRIKDERYWKGIGRTVQCSAQPPPPAWPGRVYPESGYKTWDGPKPISIVGSTGSIGTEVFTDNPRFKR